MYTKSERKVEVPVKWTKHLMTTHPIVFITTIGELNGKLIAGAAPFATCLDTSYEPPYLTFSAALKQHSILGGPVNTGEMNTVLNIRQFPYFVVNVPGVNILDKMDTLAVPYERNDYRDKIELAGLTKLEPFQLSRHRVYPPIIGECLAHLECEVVDIHQPPGSDHWNITGKVVGVSYDKSLGKDIDEVRISLVEQNFHHFGSNAKVKSERYIASTGKIHKMPSTLIFHLEKHEVQPTEVQAASQIEKPNLDQVSVPTVIPVKPSESLRNQMVYNYILVFIENAAEHIGNMIVKISPEGLSHEKMFWGLQNDEAKGFRVELRGTGKMLVNFSERTVLLWEEHDTYARLRPRDGRQNVRLVKPILKHYGFPDFTIRWDWEDRPGGYWEASTSIIERPSLFAKLSRWIN